MTLHKFLLIRVILSFFLCIEKIEAITFATLNILEEQLLLDIEESNAP